jgi:hypothetical protein
MARGSLAFETCASPGVNNGGEISNYSSTGLYLHHAIIRHEKGNAVDRRITKRWLLSVLAERECGYHMSRGCHPRANVADFETLKIVVGCTRAWMTSDGGFDAKTGR